MAVPFSVSLMDLVVRKKSSEILKVFLIIIGSIVGLIIIIFLIFIGIFFYYTYQDHRFGTYEIPEKYEYLKKPIPYLNYAQKDSLHHIHKESNDLLVIGDGYSGYTFYSRYQPSSKGTLFIKGYETERNIELMPELLKDRTSIIIDATNNLYQLHSEETAIHEGTFDKFYPARFELWFQSNNEILPAVKIIEKEYLIDGWDR